MMNLANKLLIQKEGKKDREREYNDLTAPLEFDGDDDDDADASVALARSPEGGGHRRRPVRTPAEVRSGGILSCVDGQLTAADRPLRPEGAGEKARRPPEVTAEACSSPCIIALHRAAVRPADTVKGKVPPLLAVGGESYLLINFFLCGRLCRIQCVRDEE